MTCAHCAGVVNVEPPRPPSATYSLPSGPNFNPRGLLRPVAKTEIVADTEWPLPPFFPCPGGGFAFPAAAANARAATSKAASPSRFILSSFEMTPLQEDLDRLAPGAEPIRLKRVFGGR